MSYLYISGGFDAGDGVSRFSFAVSSGEAGAFVVDESGAPVRIGAGSGGAIEDVCRGGGSTGVLVGAIV